MPFIGARCARRADHRRADTARGPALKRRRSGHFGSGWAWLVRERGALKVITTANADTPIVRGLSRCW